MEGQKKTYQMQVMEREYGADITTICRGALASGGSVRGAARLLRVNYQTFRNWLSALGIDASAVYGSQESVSMVSVSEEVLHVG